MAAHPAVLMRAVYTLLWHCARPLLPLRLWWRGRKEPGYREAVDERFARYGDAPPGGDIVWVHAVSAGETRAAVPLVLRILAERPHARVLLTAMTATGREAGRALFGDRVIQAWLPYDLPGAVARFVAHFAPRVGIVMETEVWPNLLRECRARGVPVFLVNARLSARSAAGYARLGSLARASFASFAGVAAQTPADAQRLATVGAREPQVFGNLKFDVAVDDAGRALAARFRERFGSARRIFLAAATRDGEEALIVDALARQPLPGAALTLVVPRHPQRFDAVAELLRARGLTLRRRSEGNAAVPADVAFVLGDSMGEMAAYYGCADIAFVGGSLLPFGGQNLIEPIAQGVPTLVGPHTFNFADVAEDAVAAGAALRVADAGALVAAAATLLDDDARRAAMRAHALAFHAAHRGAVDRLWRWLAPALPDS
jgi:3-deoxy-D-manno-octulosonic-acid transferase